MWGRIRVYMVSHPELPSHVKDLVENWRERAYLVRGLNCFGVAAIFFFPELIGFFEDRGSLRGNKLAEQYLFEMGQFEERKVGYDDSSHTLIAYSFERAGKDWLEMRKISHVHVDLGYEMVLAKSPSSGMSRVRVVSATSDLKEWFGVSAYDREHVALVRV